MRVRRTKDDIIYLNVMDNLNIIAYEYPLLYVEKRNMIYNKLIDNVKIEKRASFRGSFLKFCSLTNYDFEAEREMIRVKKKYKKDSLQMVSYKDIPDVNFGHMEEIKRNRINKQCATLMDKLVLEKYYFKEKYWFFNEEKLEEIFDKKLYLYFEKMDNSLLSLLDRDGDLEEINLNSFEITEEMELLVNNCWYCEIDDMRKRIMSILGYLLPGMVKHSRKYGYYLSEEMMLVLYYWRKIQKI